MQAVCSLALVLALFCQGFDFQRYDRQNRECFEFLSGYVMDPNLKAPEFPTDLKKITLHYREPGCYGDCPVFRLKLTEKKVEFEGFEHVRTRGKKSAKLSAGEFERLLRQWYDGRFYAMRDGYCEATCPNGSQIVFLDRKETLITLETPSFRKVVFECYGDEEDELKTPKPPPAYFKLRAELRNLAKSRRWL